MGDGPTHPKYASTRNYITYWGGNEINIGRVMIQIGHGPKSGLGDVKCFFAAALRKVKGYQEPQFDVGPFDDP